MKFISKLLNLLLLCFSFCLTTIAEWSIYNVVALPAGSDSSIAVASKKEDKVAYFDTFKFLGEDLKASVQREPRYMIRSWFNADWWQRGMKWADVAAEVVIGSVVPVATPTYEVNQLQYYYSEYTGCTSYTVYGLESETQAIPVISGVILGASSEKLDFCENYLYYEEAAHSELSYEGTLYRVSGGNFDTKVKIAHWNTLDKATSSYAYNNKSCKTFVNTIMKVNKYNSGEYTKWVNKFLVKDTTGSYSIKTSVISLYFQFYLAIAIAIWFVYQNPIKIKRNADGEEEMTGGIKFRKKDKKKKNKK